MFRKRDLILLPLSGLLAAYWIVGADLSVIGAAVVVVILVVIPVGLRLWTWHLSRAGPNLPPDDPDLLTPDQAAELLDVPVSYLVNLAMREGLPYERYGRGMERMNVGNLRFRREDVEQLAAEGEVSE